MVALPLHVPKIGERLRVLGIGLQLQFEFLAGLVVTLGFPVEITQAEMDARLLGSNSGGGFELSDRFGRFAQSVERLSHQNVSWRRVGALLQQQTKFLKRAIEFLRQKTTLRQHLMKLRICRICLAGRPEVLGSQIELSLSVVAHPEQSSRLSVVRICGEYSAKRSC